MMGRTLLLTAAVTLGLVATADAQPRTVSEGMTRAQVVSTLGTPAEIRERGEWTYLFYHNGCAIRCGSDDVVFLREGRAVAAVFRTGARRFSGPDTRGALGATPRERVPDRRLLGEPATERPPRMEIPDDPRNAGSPAG